MNNHSHLGDGVYAEFDGYGIQLRANDHRDELCTDRIYLEPDVIQKIVDFYKYQVELHSIKKQGEKDATRTQDRDAIN